MIKYIFSLLILIAAITAPAVISKAQDHGFALVAVSPQSQKTVCIEQNESSILSALTNYGFTPKQDESGFIYSLVGHDGPASSDPAAQNAFWSFWIGEELSFSNLGASQVHPQNSELYVFYFGNGNKPQQTFSYNEICKKPEPAPATPAEQPVPQQTTQTPSSQPIQSVTSSIDLSRSFHYLRDNYLSQGQGGQDWAALALGANDQSITVNSTSSSSVLSLSRNALARAAQDADRSTHVTAIKNSYRDSQFGETELINDDIFAILAIHSTDPMWLKNRQGAFDNILSSQRPNGSFGFSRNGDGDTDMTAAALWALALKDQRPTAEINKALSYLASAQNSDGGFGFQPGAPSNVASTSWVILAYRAVGKDTTLAADYLLVAKQPNGYWLFGNEPSYLNTAYAVLALSGKTMPIKNQVTQQKPPVVNQRPKPTLPISPSTPIIEVHEIVVTESTDASVHAHSHSATSSCSASASASASGTSASASASASCQ